MKKMLALMVCLGLLGIAGSAAAYAPAITFEDLYPEKEAIAITIPDGYMGFSWANALCITKNYYSSQTGGLLHNYEVGTLGNVSMYAPEVSETAFLSFSIKSGSFDFNNAYITSAWESSANVTVTGWRSGSLIYSRDIITYNDKPYAFDFGWSDIDTVQVWSGNHIAIDNINSINAVPLPGAVLLLGTGLLCLAHYRRRKLTRRS